MKRLLKLILSIIFLYGIFLILIKAAQALSSTNTTSQNSANACSLETSIPNMEACRDGFNSSISLITNLIKKGELKACGIQFPNFQQLNPVCKEYYSNSSLTGSCLNGLTSGTTQKLALVGVDCATINRDNVVAAISALAATGTTMFYHHATQTNAAQKLSDKIFCMPEESINDEEKQALRR